MTNRNEHYFASCVFGWATAESRKLALEKLALRFFRELKPVVLNSHKAGDAGVYFWSCRVLAPSDTSYEIINYSPSGVAKDGGAEHALTYITAKVAAFHEVNA